MSTDPNDSARVCRQRRLALMNRDSSKRFVPLFSVSDGNNERSEHSSQPSPPQGAYDGESIEPIASWLRVHLRQSRAPIFRPGG